MAEKKESTRPLAVRVLVILSGAAMACAIGFVAALFAASYYESPLYVDYVRFWGAASVVFVVGAALNILVTIFTPIKGDEQSARSQLTTLTLKLLLGLVGYIIIEMIEGSLLHG